MLRAAGSSISTVAILMAQCGFPHDIFERRDAQEVSYDRITRIDSDDRLHAWASPVTDRQILLQEHLEARYLVIDTMSLYNDKRLPSLQLFSSD